MGKDVDAAMAEVVVLFTWNQESVILYDDLKNVTGG